MTHAQNIETLRNLPVILAEAERMAQAWLSAYSVAASAWISTNPGRCGWSDPPKPYEVRDVFVGRLLSLDAASRDALVRLGIEHDMRWRYWHALRDNPEVLVAALVAVLEARA